LRGTYHKRQNFYDQPDTKASKIGDFRGKEWELQAQGEREQKKKLGANSPLAIAGAEKKARQNP